MAMRIPRVKITLRWMLLLVAIVSAYFAGVVSQRSKLSRAWKNFNSVRTELALETEHAAFAERLQEVRVTNRGDLDRVEKLLDKLDTYEVRISQIGDPSNAETEP